MAKSVRSTDVQLGAFGLVAVLCTVKLPIDLYIISSLEQLSSTILSKTPERSYCIQFTGPARAICGEAYFTGRFHWLDIQNKWIPFVYLNIAYTATVLLYIASFLVACGLSRNYDCEWLWVRSDLIILSVLVLFGAGVGAAYANIDWSDTSKTTTGILSESTCGVLGKYCLPARLSVLSVWPIVAALSALLVFESVYVRKHGFQGMAVRHSLSFLQAVPFEQRGTKTAYWAPDGDTMTSVGVIRNEFEHRYTSLIPFQQDGQRAHEMEEDVMATEAGSDATTTRRPPLNPALVQTVTVSTAAFLGVAKLGADAYMFMALRNLWLHYREQVEVWCVKCTVPDYVVQKGDEAVKKWNIALERKEVINLWLIFNSCNLAYSILVLLYILTYFIVHFLVRNRDIEWVWVRSNVVIFLLLVVLGVAAGSTFPFLYWPFDWSPDWKHYTRHPSDESVYSIAVCNDLGNDCIASRLSMIIVWPIAAIFLGLAVYEIGYVVRHHSWRLGWHHSLSFLHAIPVEQRGSKNAYAHRSKEPERPKREKRSQSAPVTFTRQDEAPPVYTDPTGNFVTATTFRAPYRPRLPLVTESLPVYSGFSEIPSPEVIAPNK